MNNKSESIGKLAEALSKAQGKMEGAKKTSTNPFFSSKYADLASVLESVRDIISEHGLSVVQTMKVGELVPYKITTTDKFNKSTTTDLSVNTPIIVTTLLHSSGEWISGELAVAPVKGDPQSMGSAITYGRRYALAAILGVAQVDDDGETAMGRDQNEAQNESKVVKYPAYKDMPEKDKHPYEFAFDKQDVRRLAEERLKTAPPENKARAVEQAKKAGDEIL